MNIESSFARWRWAPRRASAPVDDAVAIWHVAKPTIGERIAGVVLATVIGVCGAALLVHWWSS